MAKGDSVTHIRAKAMRRRMTPPEARLWTRLRAHRLQGYQFRRHPPIGPSVLDFYCPAAKLAIEVDGSSHDQPARAAKDRQRTGWLNHFHRIRVIRIAATDVRDELDGVLAFIVRLVRERVQASAPPPPPPFRRSPSPSATGR